MTAAPTRSLRTLLIAALVLLAAGGTARVANADVFGAISLISASPFSQAEYAHDPDVSEDGRYVVFDGSVAGVPGVWRREAGAGGAIEQVAGGDATLPSVSADGRYVSFTTNEGAGLPAITNGRAQSGEFSREAPGVYVRDMDRGPSEAGAFTLASAKDHSTQSLTYEFPGADEAELETDATTLGATAAGRSAITADGRSVAFVTTAQSDLAGSGTPPLQVAVRHLETQQTQLVSVRFDPATGEAAVDPETGGAEPVQEFEGHGAVWTKGTPPQFAPRGSEIPRAYNAPRLAGASISADGSTVAWLGQQISEQARTLPGETLQGTYAEPLWRRIGDGPLVATRRVTGGSDPESPECLAHPESELPSAPSAADPCQGPFATQDTGNLGTWNDAQSDTVTTPSLSADGNEVAFISSAPLTSEAGGFGIGGREYNSDAYWVEMTAPTRVAALRQLTQFASGEPSRVSTNAGIDDIAISSDGQQVAFVTKRTVFPLGVPAYVSVPSSVPGLAEVYEADLADQTLTRVTHGYEGGVPEHPEQEKGTEERYSRVADGAFSPSFSAHGESLAFSSTAANLVFGDGNTPAIDSSSDFADGSDAYLVPRITFAPEPTPQSISPAPANPSPQPPWKLTVTASSLSDGEVQIRATVPAAGALSASATSALPASSAKHSARAKRKRTVAQGHTVARSGSVSVVRLQLKLAARYRALANRSGGLPGTVTVTFVANGHPKLRRTLTVRFRHRHAQRPRKSKR